MKELNACGIVLEGIPDTIMHWWPMCVCVPVRHAREGGVVLQDTPVSTGSSKQRRLTVFSGFVSYEQLEQKLVWGQKKGLPWLPKSVEGPHPVRMRGPGSSNTTCAKRCCVQARCTLVSCTLVSWLCEHTLEVVTKIL